MQERRGLDLTGERIHGMIFEIPKETVMNAPDDKPAQSNDSPMPDSDPKATQEDAAQKPLSKEEQLARFEESLKHDDWGHQPC
jgi:hypothetical protein